MAVVRSGASPLGRERASFPPTARAGRPHRSGNLIARNRGENDKNVAVSCRAGVASIFLDCERRPQPLASSRWPLWMMRSRFESCQPHHAVPANRSFQDIAEKVRDICNLVGCLGRDSASLAELNALTGEFAPCVSPSRIV
jgi:hypothetical protein